MLRLLKQFPVMTIHHLYTLTPASELKNGKVIQPFFECKRGLQLCRDRIRKLFELHFVNKYSPRLALGEGTSVQYVWLDRAGYRYLDVNGRPPKDLSQEYMHHARILDVYCILTEMNRHGTIRLDYLKACYAYKPKTMNIEPDLIVAFQKDGMGYRYFLEIDNCEKKEADEIAKIERYRDWELGSQWIKEEWADVYKRRFPKLLYLFSGPVPKMRRRTKVFMEAAHQQELRAECMPIEDFADKILRLGNT